MSLTSGKQLLFKAAATANILPNRSLRFNSGDSSYLSRTYSTSNTDAKKQTYSFWIKRTGFGSQVRLLDAYDGTSNNSTCIFFESSDAFRFDFGGSSNFTITTSAVFRDPTAWYHIVLAVDTTQGTNTNRVKIYVNGTQLTSFSTANWPNQNTTSQFPYANADNRIAAQWGGTGSSFNAYLVLFYFIDGQALTPGDFAETNLTTGQWVPKTYSGTYGTNGFLLNFQDNSGTTATTLGKDTSGNSNNWTPNNFSVTSGSGNDSLGDHPVSAGSSNGFGGEVSGNYCTWNSIATNSIYFATLSNGNLESTASGDNRIAYGTIAIPSSGKWYFEVTTTGSPGYPYIGVAAYSGTSSAYPQDNLSPSLTYYGATGEKDIEGTYTSYGATYSNATIGVAVNVDSSQVTFYKDGVSQGTISKSVVGAFPFASTGGGSGTFILNAGQRAFAYTAPSGFSPLVDTLLPTPTIAKPSDVFKAGLYTGTGSSSAIAVAGPPNPDFVWIKCRSNGTSHALYDEIRGNTKRLYSNGTDAQYTYGSAIYSPTSTGIDITTTDGDHNTLNRTYVAWMWEAGSSNASNGDGTITSTVRANTSAGFSIVTYTGNGTAGATVGHGLGVEPQFLIIKSTGITNDWIVYSKVLGNNKSLFLDLNFASTTTTNFNNTTPSATVFTVSASSEVNGNGSAYVAYCWTPVAGYSSFGSYTGNGSSDGPFVFTGMRPAFVLIKNSSSTSGNWIMYDNSRLTYNLNSKKLASNLSVEENNVSSLGGDTIGIDFLSNGFKVRTTGGNHNVNADIYIYAAFAENPFAYARAR